MVTTTRTTAQQPPLVPGLPLIGNGLEMRTFPIQYLVKLYQEYGPVFRLKLLNKRYTIMAGLEANRFLARDGERYLGSEELFGSFGRELKSDAFMVAMDGASHRHQRKLQRRGYSRDAILSRLLDVINLQRSVTDQWQPGQRLQVFASMQHIVTEQLALVLTNCACGDYFDDVQFLFNTNMKVNVMKTHPSIFMKQPRYGRAKARSNELARAAMQWHRDNPPTDRQPDLIDDLMNAVDENGEPYSESTIMAALLGAYFAGMDTVASTASFMLYAILKTPGVLQRLQAELDAAFVDGQLPPEKLRQMEVLHGAAIETLRLYPVAAFTPRTVTEPFEFGGFTLETGTEVLVANGVTHYLPEFYPDPEKFDVDRHQNPDHPKTPQAFAPYTLGAHTCLGAGMAEVQLMTVLATLLHAVDLRLDPPDFDITVYTMPIPNPGRKFSVEVVKQRG